MIFVPPPQSPCFFINEVISSSFLPHGGGEEEEEAMKRGSGLRRKSERAASCSKEAEVCLQSEMPMKKRERFQGDVTSDQTQQPGPTGRSRDRKEITAR